MELRVLRYFLAVAKEESITNAAKALNVTQPTLSKQLMDLEAELGKQLLIRGKRRTTLTEEGILLRKRAQEILELVDKTETEIAGSDEQISGDLYIGGGETAAMHLIAKVVSQMREAYPQVRFHFYSGNANDVTERLDKGLLDFGIIIGTAHIANYDYLQLPATDTWGLLMRKDSALALSLSLGGAGGGGGVGGSGSCDGSGVGGGGVGVGVGTDVNARANDAAVSSQRVRPEHLIGLPLLGSRQALEGNELSGWFSGYSADGASFGSNTEKLNFVATYNLIYNAAIMVEENVGYALCLDGLVNTSESSPLCFKPLEPALLSPLYLVWKKAPVFSKVASKFLAMLRELV